MRSQPNASEFRLQNPEIGDDGTFQRLVDCIFRLYRAATGRACPWDAACGRNLRDAVRRLDGWTSEQLMQAIENKFASEENHFVSPKTWLPRLEEYAAAPLDRYRQPVERGTLSRRDESDLKRLSYELRMIYEATVGADVNDTDCIRKASARLGIDFQRALRLLGMVSGG